MKNLNEDDKKAIALVFIVLVSVTLGVVLMGMQL
jgi:hypothetical protein